MQVKSLDQLNQNDEEVSLVDFSKIFTENNSTNEYIAPQKMDKLEVPISTRFPIIELMLSILLASTFIGYNVFHKTFRK